MPVVKTQNLVKSYRSEAGFHFSNVLSGIDLEIEKGEFTAIMGPSGSGKTTLLNIISGLEQPTLGELEVLGEDLTQKQGDDLILFRRNKTGIITQQPFLLEDMTIEENILLPLVIQKKIVSGVDRKVKALAKRFHLEEVLGLYPSQISGGQQQRAAACRALITEPSLLFADEPTGNLDSKNAQKFMNYLQDINKSEETTIIMATHDPYAASHCKRVVFIKDGKIYSELRQKGDHKQFFLKILDFQSVMGGVRHEL